MKKEKDILIRIDSELKEKVKKKAQLLGLSVSSCSLWKYDKALANCSI